ncbi:MAG: hypothetical protein PHW32_04400 [Bacilli bacterium]|nr:hypothetical protein [Bacilli bacterium]MDD4719176.1 hypothetical protein [Bacilli bacterium]
MKEKVNNFDEIVNLFRKIIASALCIEKKTVDEKIRQTSSEYLEDFINQYENYLMHKNIDKIDFKFSEKEIVDFANECYEKVDIFIFAEDLQFGFSELMERILEMRGINNG